MQPREHLSFGTVVLLFLVSRLFLEVVGLLAMFYFPPATVLGPARDLRYHRPVDPAIDIWARWDSEWYILIAEKGYSSFGAYREQGGGRYLPEETSKFFPAYPMAIRALNLLTNNSVVSGIIVSNLSAVLLLYFLYGLMQKRFDEESAFQGTVFLVVFPTSFFLSAVYTESLFLAAMVGTFYFLETRRIWPAALTLAVACATRHQGVLAIPAVLWLLWNRTPEKRGVHAVVILAAGLLPFLGYLLFVQQTTGSFRWIAESVKYWRGEIRYPLYALVRFFRSDIAIHGQHNSIIDFSMAMIQLGALVFSFRRLPRPYTLYSAIAVLFPLTSSLFSFSRLALGNFPFFILMGITIRRLSLPLQIGLAILLAFFFAAFTLWYWVA